MQSEAPVWLVQLSERTSAGIAAALRYSTIDGADQLLHLVVCSEFAYVVRCSQPAVRYSRPSKQFEVETTPADIPVTGCTTPRSVMMECTSRAGVTSKAGLKASTPRGAACDAA